MLISAICNTIYITILFPLNSFVCFEIKDDKQNITMYVYDASQVCSEEESDFEDIDLSSNDTHKDK